MCLLLSGDLGAELKTDQLKTLTGPAVNDGHQGDSPALDVIVTTDRATIAELPGRSNPEDFKHTQRKQEKHEKDKSGIG